MSDQILLGTRKGTLILDRRASRWTPRPIAHGGMSISYAARDPRDGTMWAAMDHAHWGPKLSRSKDDGATWENLTQLAYPKGARFLEDHLPTPDESPGAEKPITYKNASLLKVWTLAFCGKDQPDTLHASTLPGGLFTSTDGGDTWELNRPLWNHESRGGDLFAGPATSRNQWGGTPAAMAYGEFVPGIHSVLVDPRDSKHLLVAVSCAGVVETRDGGLTWQGRNRGMLNDSLHRRRDGEAAPARERVRGRRAHLRPRAPGRRGGARRPGVDPSGTLGGLNASAQFLVRRRPLSDRSRGTAGAFHVLDHREKVGLASWFNARGLPTQD